MVLCIVSFHCPVLYNCILSSGSKERLPVIKFNQIRSRFRLLKGGTTRVDVGL